VESNKQKHRQFLLWAAAVQQKLNSTILWTQVNRLGRLQRFPGAEFNHNHSAELLRPGGHQLLGATARSPVFCHSLPQPLLFKDI